MPNYRKNLNHLQCATEGQLRALSALHSAMMALNSADTLTETELCRQREYAENNSGERRYYTDLQWAEESRGLFGHVKRAFVDALLDIYCNSTAGAIYWLMLDSALNLYEALAVLDGASIEEYLSWVASGEGCF